MRTQRTRSTVRILATAAVPLLGIGLLTGCGSGSSTSPTDATSTTGSPSPSPDLAADALVTAAQVATIAGPGFAPYQTQTVASATEPAACLGLLRLADGTRSAPPATVSSATVTFANGSTGSSITNTAHVFTDAATADRAVAELTALVPRCSSFSVAVGNAVLKGSIVPAAVSSAPARALAVRVVITSPTQKADVTSVVVPSGRTLVVAVAGTPDGANEGVYAVKTAAISAAKAATLR